MIDYDVQNYEHYAMVPHLKYHIWIKYDGPAY